MSKPPCVMCVADQSVQRGYTASGCVCILLAWLSEPDAVEKIAAALCIAHRRDYDAACALKTGG